MFQYGISLKNMTDVSNDTVLEIAPDTFPSTLFRLDLSNNKISRIAPNTFPSSLLWLALQGNTISFIDPDAFQNLHHLEMILTDNYGICCLFNETVDCRAPSSPFNTCEAMVPNNVIRVALWVVCVFALLTNVAVIVSRMKSRIPVLRHTFSSAPSNSQNVFLVNLAVADFLMGVYLLTIGIADAIFGKGYYLSAVGWRNGIVCIGVGFVGFIANIASILTLTVVSFERFCVIMFPFGMYIFSPKLITAMCVIIWITSGLMALTPIILAKFVKEIFGFSDVCLGLPFVPIPHYSEYQVAFVYNASEGNMDITENTDSDNRQWVYSQIVYIYFSATCVSVITLCYIAIFMSAIANKVRSGRSGDSKDEIKLALRISIIVGTDLLCWLPVIITGILSQKGLAMSTEMYVWFAVFVMPINSAFNPFIYTSSTIRNRKKNESSLMT